MKTVKLATFIENPDNPQTVTAEDFALLVESLRTMPQTLAASKIAYVTDYTAVDGADLRGQRVVIAGNKRLRALKQLAADHATSADGAIKFDGPLPAEWFYDLTPLGPDARRAWLIKSNVQSGEWDAEKLLALYDRAELGDLMGDAAIEELPKLIIDINEPPILFGEIRNKENNKRDLTDHTFTLWQKRRPQDKNFCDINERERNISTCFQNWIIKDSYICPSLVTSGCFYLWEVPRKIDEKEILLAQSFPSDYKASGKTSFYCGMSVAPVQMAHIASAIYEQWLKPIHAAAERTAAETFELSPREIELQKSLGAANVPRQPPNNLTTKTKGTPQ